MSYLFLENPKYLLIFLSIIDFTLFFSLKNIPFDKKKLAIIVLSLLIPIIYTVSVLVVTNNEKIEKILIEIGKTSNTLQIDSVTKFLDKNFTGEYQKKFYTKTEFIALLKEKVGNKTVNGINLDKRKIVFLNDIAKSTIISFVDFTTTEGVFRLSLKWDITWKKRGENWFLFKTKSPQMFKF